MAAAPASAAPPELSHLWPGVSAMLRRAMFDPNVSFLEKMRHGSTGIVSSEAQRDTSNVHAVCASGMTPAA